MTTTDTEIEITPDMTDQLDGLLDEWRRELLQDGNLLLPLIEAAHREQELDKIVEQIKREKDSNRRKTLRNQGVKLEWSFERDRFIDRLLRIVLIEAPGERTNIKWLTPLIRRIPQATQARAAELMGPERAVRLALIDVKIDAEADIEELVASAVEEYQFLVDHWGKIGYEPEADPEPQADPIDLETLTEFVLDYCDLGEGSVPVAEFVAHYLEATGQQAAPESLVQAFADAGFDEVTADGDDLTGLQWVPEPVEEPAESYSPTEAYSDLPETYSPGGRLDPGTPMSFPSPEVIEAEPEVIEAEPVAVQPRLRAFVETRCVVDPLGKVFKDDFKREMMLAEIYVGKWMQALTDLGYEISSTRVRVGGGKQREAIRGLRWTTPLAEKPSPMTTEDSQDPPNHTVKVIGEGAAPLPYEDELIAAMRTWWAKVDGERAAKDAKTAEAVAAAEAMLQAFKAAVS